MLSLWQIDNNHKMINIIRFSFSHRWIVKTYTLYYATNSTSVEVLFEQSVQHDGLPSTVRRDRGLENIGVARRGVKRECRDYAEL